MPTVRLDRKLYPRAALDEAAKAFAHLARVEISVDGIHHRVRFLEVEPDAAGRIADEFANFALVRAVERARKEGAA